MLRKRKPSLPPIATEIVIAEAVAQSQPTPQELKRAKWLGSKVLPEIDLRLERLNEGKRPKNDRVVNSRFDCNYTNVSSKTHWDSSVHIHTTDPDLGEDLRERYEEFGYKVDERAGYAEYHIGGPNDTVLSRRYSKGPPDYYEIDLRPAIDRRMPESPERI